MQTKRRLFVIKVKSRFKKQSLIGHSLIELMVVFGIIAVIVLSTLPSYTQMLERYRLNRSLELWRNALQLAKTSAYTGRTQTSICPLQRIMRQCTSWKLPYDALKISTQNPEKIIQIIELPYPVASASLSASSGSSKITFDVTGRSLTALSIRLQQGQFVRTLKLSRLGRIRTE